METKEEILKEVGARLRKFRNEKGYNREFIAKYLCITERTYASYERGEHDIPMDVMYKLALMYRTTLANLIDYKKAHK